MSDGRFRCVRSLGVVLLLSLLLCLSVVAQEPPKKKPPVPGPMLGQGTMDFDTPDFNLSLVRSSQTVAALKPKGAGGFDFTPGDLLVERSQNGYYHLGDLDLRLRTGNSGAWKNYSTAVARDAGHRAARLRRVLAAADLTPTLPADMPLQITRPWSLKKANWSCVSC